MLFGGLQLSFIPRSSVWHSGILGYLGKLMGWVHQEFVWWKKEVHGKELILKKKKTGDYLINNTSVTQETGLSARSTVSFILHLPYVEFSHKPPTGEAHPPFTSLPSAPCSPCDTACHWHKNNTIRTLEMMEPWHGINIGTMWGDAQQKSILSWRFIATWGLEEAENLAKTGTSIR